MASSPQHSNIAAGIVWMIATMFCFLALDAVMKHLLESYSVIQVSWARFTFATLFAMLATGRRLPQLIVSRSPKLQLTRSLFLMLTTASFNAGIRTVPLATAATIMFLSPILITLLAIPLLGERVGPRRLAGVAAGFAGALIVVRPWEEGIGGFSVGILFLLAAALLNANYQIITRKVRGDDPLTSLIFTALAGALALSLIVPWFWTPPDLMGWVAFALTGALGGLGHLCLIRSLNLAPASAVAPFSYTGLIWATLFGYLFFAEVPDGWTLLGATIIIAAGLYIFFREQQLGKPEKA